jgi:hypothetical protein
MANLKTYKLDPAGNNTFGGAAIVSANSFTINESGDVSPMSSDGFSYIQAVFVDNITATVTVSAKDVSSTIRVGSCDDLVLKALQKADCTVTTPDSVTFTFANAVVTGVDRTVNHTGESEITVNFQVYKPDGTDFMVIS